MTMLLGIMGDSRIFKIFFAFASRFSKKPDGRMFRFEKRVWKILSEKLRVTRMQQVGAPVTAARAFVRRNEETKEGVAAHRRARPKMYDELLTYSGTVINLFD